ncbi:MAG: diguanylate cyclase [Verrucomicrobia bacterium]|nr:diguanylate cyclase [Verrucomicrobiota bacterium]
MMERTTDGAVARQSFPKADRPIRVLVLDDEAALRDLVQQTLVRAGCEVTTAAEGGEGLQALLSKRFDVVVSDLMMEPMDGITFLTEALRIWPWMGVVVFSGFIQEDIRERAGKIGVTTILEKPISFRDLAEKVIEEANGMQARITGGDQVTLDHIQYELSILREITKAAIEASSLPQALRDLSESLGQSLPSLAAGILSLEDEPSDSILVLSVRAPVTEAFIKQMELSIRNRFRLLVGKELPEALEVELQGAALSDAGTPEAVNVFSVPIVSGGRVSGMLALAPPTDYTYNESDMSFLYHAANHLTTVLIAFQRIRELAVRDELTGLYNRHHLQDELTSVWQMAKRYGFSTGILIIDIDHFKTFNDTYGHPTGDEVLRELGEIAATVCRDSDIIARYGGDEIVIVLPDAIPESLGVLAERLLVAVRSHLFCRDSHELKCSVSVGAASSRADDGGTLPPDEVLAHADKALYVAKRNGRDRSSVWTEDSTDHHTSGLATTREGTAAPEEAIAAARAVPHVAVIDDDTSVLSIMKLILEMEGCDPVVFATAQEARDYVAQNPGGLDVAFVDLNLDDESGLDLIREFKSTDSAMVTIVITGDATLDNAVNSLRHGAYDFIQKPVQREQLKITLARAIEYRGLRVENLEYQNHLEDMVRRKSRELTNALQRTRDSFEFTLRAMTTMLDSREHATGAHSQRVQDITELVGKEIGIQGKLLDDLKQGALLHDIGKIAIPDAILLKPGPLTEEEWVIMRTHAQIGYDIIRTSPDLKGAAKIVGCHHENWDGNGYPNGLSEEEIPIGARIFALADAYDAMRSDRPYRAGMPPEDATAELHKHRGSQFDPKLVDVFLGITDQIEAIGKWAEENEKAEQST